MLFYSTDSEKVFVSGSKKALQLSQYVKKANEQRVKAQKCDFLDSRDNSRKYIIEELHLEKDLKNIAVVIPAYKPDKALMGFSQELLTKGFGEIIVVDDGSGKEYSDVFTQVKNAGCLLLEHDVNKGKGRALKTAFEYILREKPYISAVVTADADGQHLIKDIIKVGQKTLETDNALVIGGRVFSGKVPLRSRLGNAITRGVFNFVSGQRVHDTQTGLRGIPINSLEKISKLVGERYEFEMNMLLEAKLLKLKIVEIEIETVYIDDNSSSHFNALTDSWKIYKQIFMFSGATIYRHIIMFGGSSLIAFGIDYALFSLLTIIVPKLFIEMPPQKVVEFLGLSFRYYPDVLIATLAARAVSSTVNFFINRNVVFAKKDGSILKHAISYYLLVIIIIVANNFIITGLISVGLNVYLAKIITEAILFICSFFIQKRFIFK